MTQCLTKLDPTKTIFLLCDVQEKFRKAIPLFGKMVQNISKLLKAGKELEVPLIVSEQYPKGLGNTIKELDVSNALQVFPKTQYSMYVPEMITCLEKGLSTKPQDMVLFGIETHVCVLQTCIDLLQNDYKVHLVADCCASRLNQDRDIALALLRQIGCFVQTSETVIFNLLTDKENPKFNTVRKFISKVSTDMELTKVSKKQSNGNKQKKSADKKASQNKKSKN